MTRREASERRKQWRAALHAARICVLVLLVVMGWADASSAAGPWCPTIQRSVSSGQTIDMLALCADNSGHALTMSIVTGPAQGTAVLLDATHIRYTASLTASGSDTFSYRVRDINGIASPLATVTLTFGQNRAPVCSAVSASVTAGSAIGILVPHDASDQRTCSDPDGDPLSAIVGTPPAKGVVSTDPYSRQFRYTANAGSSGTDQFTFAVSDGRGGTSLPVSASITIVANQPPTCSNTSHTVLPGNSRVIIACSDPDGEGVAFVVATPPVQGSISVVNGRLTYTANGNAAGVDTFSYQGHDGKDASAVVTASITITASNRIPSCASQTIELAAGASVVSSSQCSDLDRDLFTLLLMTPPTRGTVTLLSAASGFAGFRYEASPTASGTDTFTIVADDGVGGVSAPASVNVNFVQNPSVCAANHLFGARDFYRPITAWYGTAADTSGQLRNAIAITDQRIEGSLEALIGRDARLDPRAQQLNAFTSPVLNASRQIVAVGSDFCNRSDYSGHVCGQPTGFSRVHMFVTSFTTPANECPWAHGSLRSVAPSTASAS